MPSLTPNYNEIHDALTKYMALLNRTVAPEGPAAWTCQYLAVAYDLDGVVVHDPHEPPHEVARRHAVAAGEALRQLRRSDPEAARETLLVVLRAVLPAS
jgi:hypothetical protein